MKKTRTEHPCGVCETKGSIDYWQEPIEYWGCRRCGSVFVHDKDGMLSLLDIGVEYRPKD